GMPNGSATMGSFERWAEIMSGILDAAGVPGLLENQAQVKVNSDTDTSEWIALCEAWWAEHGALEVRPSDILTIAKRDKLLEWVWSGRKDDSGHSRFGRQLTKRRDRIYGRFQIQKATALSSASGTGQYVLELRQK
ncbi:MAG: hypothetical protein IIC24_04540, partial [Chloroflexi bacterium]|nr:hypothetical protein [Chloroflexota bacterium]